MEKIQQLYSVERHARQQHFDHQQRLEARQQQAVPLLEEIKKHLEQA